MNKLNNEAFDEVMESVCNTDFIAWERLRNKTIFITGATGLIGYTLIRSLLYSSDQKGLNVKIIALVRDINRAKERFLDIPANDISEATCDDSQNKALASADGNGSQLFFIIGDVENLPNIDVPIDYIVHGASKTASMDFIKKPVETIETSVLGTMNALRLAKEKKVSGFVYLSSMEIYGYPKKGHKVVESDIGTFSPDDLRNSYPISKLACESLCKSYASEYKLPIMVARLTQTFGPGVNYNDGRIFAYFGRCIAENKDIVLKTAGETERSYLYTSDAVTAILTILLNGRSGESYNVADEKTYCSIAQMAKDIADDNDLKVIIEDNKTAYENGYMDTLYINLNTSAIRSLGWTPNTLNTKDMITKMSEYW